VILELPHSAANISRMLRDGEIGMISAVTVSVYECPACAFVQITESLGSAFYDDYLMTASHSLQMQQYQATQSSGFVARYDLSGKRVVDVGCGDGAYLEQLSATGVRAAGIEPSARFRELALRRRLPVFAGYVTAQTPIPESPYDGFTTRQVLEHVPDPHDFLQGIRLSLAPGAAGLVEVPSLEQAIQRQRFYDFFPDHLNYFSMRTLRVVLEINGFAVDAVERGMEGEYNVALVRLDPRVEDARLQEHANRIVAEVKEFFREEQKAGRRVAVWGSGGKGIAVMSIARAEGIAYVVDSDPHKHGRFTPVTHLPIVPPERLQTEPVDTVLVTALAYRNEICRQLLGPLGFSGKVALLGPRLEIVRNG
jgi:SAM-dependent methyltransferase